jgi:putative peptidoglycan lipid II flippase
VAAGLTTYQKAHLVFMLPHSVITVSIVTAMLPALSRIAHEGRLAEVGADVAATMRMVAALIVPVAAILVVNGASVAILLFGYGAATPEQAGLMGLIVSVFMLGMLPFTLFYVLLRGYYALEDTRTPFWLTVVFSVVLLLLVLPLFSLAPAGGTQVAAIALAYSIAYWIGFVITWWVLARRLGSMQTPRTAWVIARLVFAGVLSAGFMFATLAVFMHAQSVDSAAGMRHVAILASVVVTSVVGLAVYVLAAWVLRIHEVFDVVSLAARVVRRGSRR